MTQALIPWLALFVLASAAIVIAGALLARAGDRIADRTGLGGLFVGMVLVAAATSLPEIAVTVSAALDGAADLAIGNLLGSSMANMALLAIVDLAYRGRVWEYANPGHARTAAMAIGLTALAVLAILRPIGPDLGPIGLAPLLILVGWLSLIAWTRRSPTPAVSAGATSQAESRLAGTAPVAASSRGASDAAPSARTDGTLKRDLLTFAAAAAIILVAAPFLVTAAEGIAEESGLGATFVGASFLAFATSLPELATALAAARIGAYDLAVGSLLGSNAFNMAIILVADLAYASGPILSAVEPGQAFVGVAAILLMAIALAGIVHPARPRAARLEPSSAMSLVAYLVLMWLIWGGAA